MTDKWTVLSQSLGCESDTMLLTRTDPDSLRTMHDQGLCVIKELDGVITAFGCVWPSHEIGTVWVMPKYRGEHHASSIFAALVRQVPERGYCFVITHVAKIVHLCKAHGFTEATIESWSDMVPFADTCGVCDRVAESERGTCPFRADPHECRLFVYRR